MSERKWSLRAMLICLALAAPGLSLANMGAETEATDDPNALEGKKAIEAQDWKRAIDLLGKAAATERSEAYVVGTLRP